MRWGFYHFLKIILLTNFLFLPSVAGILFFILFFLATNLIISVVKVWRFSMNTFGTSLTNIAVRHTFGNSAYFKSCFL